ncbi:response regulator [Azospirillum agricola]|uniref:response regulator n=1 Tax=Azospirillum agricola TaxID=1720247 RepID=UPI000A0F27F3|nr:response regulator [Azospirillum agricola]MBP2227582.1 two-component system chemotaxis response regulator CheB [Azospirillum agricola]SMH59393.1 two-component system, chemotaxis family, response regulator CheB [Azospirillum lipoferum]
MAKPTILLVDDSVLMRTIIGDIVRSDEELSLVGAAENGKVALEMVKSLKPDIVLLDIEMPEMSGLEVMEHLSLTSRAKVVIISSVAQVGSPEAGEARALGAVEIIAKPSGTMSLDLAHKKGHDIVVAIRRAAGLPLPARP